MIQYPYKTRQQELPGNISIAYMDEGEGAVTLLFIHGLANYAPVWKKNIDELRKYYRCLAIDLPGNGLSDKNDHPFGMKFFADTVHEFISALGLKNVCVIGHSMGGQVAMTLLAHYPQCAEQLVLCAPAGLETFSPFERTLYHSSLHLYDMVSGEESMLRGIIENSFHRGHKQGESIITELVEIMRSSNLGYYRRMIDGCVRGMLSEPVTDLIPSIRQRTLILFGKDDALIPNRLIHHTTTEKIAVAGAALFADAQLRIIPDCGHFVQWEKATEVNRFIITFLETGTAASQ